jgi:uncharacterized membrane protein
MKEFWSQLIERLAAFVFRLLDNHPGKALGAFVGLFLGSIIVLLGFWRTMVIALFVVAGLFLGKRHDEQKDFGQLLQMLFGERK